VRFKRKIPFEIFQLISKLLIFIYPFRSGYSLSGGSSTSVPFFIVGSGRSGNTLLRRMLTAGDEVCIPPESYILPRAARKFLRYNYLPWSELSKLIVLEFESHSEFEHWHLDLTELQTEVSKLEGNERNFANIIDLVYQHYSQQQFGVIKPWGDKTPSNSLFLDHICYAFPKANYIHLIRDPRAVFSSYIKSGLMPFDTVSDKNKIIDLWLDSHIKVQHCKKRFGTSQFISLQYESLINDPELELKKICDHLKIQFTAKMLDYYKSEADGDIAANLHHANVTKPVSSDGMLKWKTDLNDQDIALIETRCMPLYNELIAKI